jgi:GT2 family glycosyltransferase
MLKVAAVVVTRNRLALLKQCLVALDGQTYPLGVIVVVDNASEHDTQEFLHAESARRGNNFVAIQLETNQGPAGGFHEGIHACLSLDCSHLWLMDDDCMADSGALAELVFATQIVGTDVLLGGNVFDRNGESINVQPVSRRPGANGVYQYPFHLSHGILELASVSFASFFIPVSIVHKVGLPLKELFIWGDDHEYSIRIERVTRIYQVGKSKMIHFKSGDAALNIARERDREFITQYKFLYRNRMFIVVRHHGVFSAEMGKFVFRCMKDIWNSMISRSHVRRKLRAIGVGIVEGFVLTWRLRGALGNSARSRRE